MADGKGSKSAIRKPKAADKPTGSAAGAGSRAGRTAARRGRDKRLQPIDEIMPFETPFVRGEVPQVREQATATGQDTGSAPAARSDEPGIFPRPDQVPVSPTGQDTGSAPAARSAEAQAVQAFMGSRGFEISDEEAQRIATEHNSFVSSGADPINAVGQFLLSFVPIVGTGMAIQQTRENFPDASNLRRTTDILLTSLSAVGDVFFLAKGAKLAGSLLAVKRGDNVTVFLNTEVYKADDAVQQAILNPDIPRTVTMISDKADAVADAERYIDFVADPAANLDRRITIVAENPSTGAIQSATRLARRAEDKGVRAVIRLNLEQDVPTAQFQTILDTFKNSGVQRIDIDVVTRENAADSVQKALDRWTTFRSQFGAPSQAEITRMRRALEADFASQDPEAVQRAARRLETFLERSGIDVRINHQELRAVDITDRTQFKQGLDFVPDGAPPPAMFAKNLDDLTGPPPAGGGRATATATTTDNIQVDAIITTGSRTNPVPLGFTAPLFPVIVQPLGPGTTPIDQPGIVTGGTPFEEPGIFPAPDQVPVSPAQPTPQPTPQPATEPPVPTPGVSSPQSPQPVPPGAPGTPELPGGTPDVLDRPEPNEGPDVIFPPEPAPPFGGTFTPTGVLPAEVVTPEPSDDFEQEPQGDTSRDFFPELGPEVAFETKPAVAASGVTGTRAAVRTRSQRRRRFPEIKGTPSDEPGPERSGLPTVAWRQAGQWVAVAPAYEIGNFSFPKGPPTGSRFFRNATDALQFVLSTGVTLTENARAHWMSFIDAAELPDIEPLKATTAEAAQTEAEVQGMNEETITETSMSSAELQRSLSGTMTERAFLRSERAPIDADLSQLQAEIEGDMVDMGFKPKAGVSSRSIFGGGFPVSIGRARPRDVFASATEVDFTDAN